MTVIWDFLFPVIILRHCCTDINDRMPRSEAQDIFLKIKHIGTAYVLCILAPSVYLTFTS